MSFNKNLYEFVNYNMGCTGMSTTYCSTNFEGKQFDEWSTDKILTNKT